VDVFHHAWREYFYRLVGAALLALLFPRVRHAVTAMALSR
jgi:hypothetical protein